MISVWNAPMFFQNIRGNPKEFVKYVTRFSVNTKKDCPGFATLLNYANCGETGCPRQPWYMYMSRLKLCAEGLQGHTTPYALKSARGLLHVPIECTWCRPTYQCQTHTWVVQEHSVYLPLHTVFLNLYKKQDVSTICYRMYQIVKSNT